MGFRVARVVLVQNSSQLSYIKEMNFEKATAAN